MTGQPATIQVSDEIVGGLALNIVNGPAPAQYILTPNEAMVLASALFMLGRKKGGTVSVPVIGVVKGSTPVVAPSPPVVAVTPPPPAAATPAVPIMPRVSK